MQPIESINLILLRHPRRPCRYYRETRETLINILAGRPEERPGSASFLRRHCRRFRCRILDAVRYGTMSKIVQSRTTALLATVATLLATLLLTTVATLLTSLLATVSAALLAAVSTTLLAAVAATT